LNPLVFFLENGSWGAFRGDGRPGTVDGRVALPLALNHVESKWACAIPARVLARKDPSTRFGAKSPLITLSSRSLVAQSAGTAAEPIKGRSGGGGRPHPKVGTWHALVCGLPPVRSHSWTTRATYTDACFFVLQMFEVDDDNLSLVLDDYDPRDHDDPDYLDALYDLDGWNWR
jgi:hypothetical protein